MAGSGRRRKSLERRAAFALVLDSDGVSKAAGGDPRAVAWIARARELRIPLTVNAVTLTETLRGSARDTQVHRLILNADVADVDRDLAAEAGRLLGRLGRKDTVDALVAITAIRLDKPTTVLTSDPDDLRALTSEHPRITVVAI